MRDETYDGMIVTGAPVEQMPYEEVTYWNEITTIFDWARTHVTSTLYICWAAQAGLYHFYGVPKYPLDKKMFGIFEHHINVQGLPIFRGFDDVIFCASQPSHRSASGRYPEGERPHLAVRVG